MNDQLSTDDLAEQPIEPSSPDEQVGEYSAREDLEALAVQALGRGGPG